MNYNNFKRHYYAVTWFGERDQETKELELLCLKVTRDGGYPFGEEVTDKFELKFALKVNKIDADSLIHMEDDPSWYIVKKDSVEWNNYEKEPGINPVDYMKEQTNKHIADIIKKKMKKETGRDFVIGLATPDDDSFKIYK